jgi:endonuclease/exonuclease/phosphatase family metal-dependent hydrolase
MGGGYYSGAMRITSWNFLHGQPLKPPTGDSNVDLASHIYATAVRSLASDVIALQEVDFNLARSGSCNQSSDVAEIIGATHWGFAPAISGTPGVKWRKLKAEEKVVLSDRGAHDSKDRKDLSESGYYGISIISKIPVKSWLRLELGKSYLGMPLAVGNEKGKLALIYVKDEPRVAIAAVLENGWTVINTHLSFVPLVNIYQLFKLSRWAKAIEREYSTRVILLGDFNLPGGIPSKLTLWKRATESLSYPSWSPKISFDYILMREEHLTQSSEVIAPNLDISDHRPISIDLH